MSSLDDLLSLGMPQGSLAAPRGMQFNIPQAAPQAPPQRQPSKLGSLLGMLGDALLVAHNQAPAYHDRMMQQQQTQALQGFLTNPDDAIAQLMRVPGQAGTAIDLHKAVHPPSETPLELKLLQHLKDHPEDAAQLHGIDAELHPGIATPYSMPEQGGTVQTPGSSGPVPGQIIGGYRFRGGHPNDPSSWEPANSGGATASTPSLPFR